MEHYAKQNGISGFYVFADDSASIGSGKTGLTITATLSKSGAAANSVSPTITEIGGGWYWIAPIAAHRDTLGRNLWQFSATGAVIAGRVERVGLVDPEVDVWGAASAADADAISASLDDAKGATFNAGTDSLEALRDRGDAAWITGEVNLTVLPLQATLTHKLEGTDFTVATSSTPLIGMNVEDEDGNAVDMDGLVLRLTIESLDKTEKYTLEDASITHSVDSFSFRVPADVTAIAREWNWTLRNTADGEKIVGGNITVEYAP